MKKKGVSVYKLPERLKVKEGIKKEAGGRILTIIWTGFIII